MTRDEARQYFKDCNLTYEILTDENLLLLRSLIEKHFRKFNLESKFDYWVKTNPIARHGNQKNEWNSRYENGKRISASISASGAYFDERGVISFGCDGFIGVCGDASERNAQPVLNAFVEWCDAMKGGAQ